MQDNELKQVYVDQIKNCYAVEYADGGHILAASNQTQINLYNPCSFELIYSLCGVMSEKGPIVHTGIIKNIKWVDKDRVLISQCSDGKLLCTQLNPYQNLLQH